ncbi:MAG: helix-hairpin-helix domain-containing protein [Candidatus Accumulibacter sp.]|jgi:competence protein ComEA|nr:helix-hairpin-helix domain-containing protein [Accumulibacter sp.]
MRRFLHILITLLALIPLLAVAAEAVNINTANEAGLQQVKGIGPSKARAIIEYREKNGPFASTDALVNVPGIGKKSLEQLKPQITVGTVEAPKPANPEDKTKALPIPAKSEKKK